MSTDKIEVGDLFHSSWFKSCKLSTFLLVFYAPIGLCLLIIRFFIALQFFAIALLLPQNKFKQKLLQIICGVMGMTISKEGDSHPHGKIFVANHVTCFDHLAIHLATNAFCPTKRKLFNFVMKPLALFLTENENVTTEQLEIFDDPVIVFPEGQTTSGETGLLAFNAVNLPEGSSIQAVGLQVSRPFLNTQSATASLTEEILVGLFLPNTHFTIKFLSIETADGEGNWKASVQNTIAESLGLVTTKFTPADKAEWLKRLLFKPPSITTMARAVQAQLSPHALPPETVIAALQRAGNVEDAVKYLRQNSLQGLPASFPKSANARMMSFQERKKIMIAAAREKYIEKNGLNIPQ